MKKKISTLIGIIIIVIVVIVVFGGYLLYRYPCEIGGYMSIFCLEKPVTPINNGQNEDQATGCKQPDFTDNFNEIRDTVSCFLNNEKSIFKSEPPVSEVLSGNCNITKISKTYFEDKYGAIYTREICSNCVSDGFEKFRITSVRKEYLEKKFNMSLKEMCNSCIQKGIQVWFECSNYNSQFGCFFYIYQDKSFSEIYCPAGV